MKSKELRDIIPGITNEQIDRIMAIHGADIEKHKQTIAILTAERDTSNDKYHEAVHRLAGLDAEYKAKAEAAEQAAEQKLDALQREFQFQNAAREAMAEIRFTSKSARKTFLDELRERNFPIQEGKIIGFDEFYAEARKTDPKAFNLDSGYPSIMDGGDPINAVTVPVDPAEAFGKFVEDCLAFDPAMDSDGWVRLL